LIAAGLEHYITAIAAIAAIGPTFVYINFMPKANGTITAVASFYINLHPINKVHT
jgi:hypothetical protein